MYGYYNGQPRRFVDSVNLKKIQKKKSKLAAVASASPRPLTYSFSLAGQTLSQRESLARETITVLRIGN